jgi:hypothetical protein
VTRGRGAGQIVYAAVVSTVGAGAADEAAASALLGTLWAQFGRTVRVLLLCVAAPAPALARLAAWGSHVLVASVPTSVADAVGSDAHALRLHALLEAMRHPALLGVTVKVLARALRLFSKRTRHAKSEPAPPCPQVYINPRAFLPCSGALEAAVEAARRLPAGHFALEAPPPPPSPPLESLYMLPECQVC